MKHLFFFILALVVSQTLFSQGRDTLVTRQLYFLERDYHKALLDTQKVWSDGLTDYIDYNRIEMGRRMNMSLKYSKRAKNQFIFGMIGIVAGSGFYIGAAYSDPVVYVESTDKYTRSYFNDAKQTRDNWIICGSVFTAVGAYFVWRSYTNNKKARWAIYPDGLRYSF